MSKWSWKKPINAFLSASLVAGLVLPAMPSNVTAATNVSDLIISEYIEGSGENKAIEFYNGTENEISLKDYKLELYSNGSSTASNTWIGNHLPRGTNAGSSAGVCCAG